MVKDKILVIGASGQIGVETHAGTKKNIWQCQTWWQAT